MNDVTFYSCEWKIIFHCASNKLLLTAHYSCSCCRTFQVSRIQLNGLSHNISRIKFLNNRETLKIGWNVNQMTLAMMLQSFMHGKFIHFVKVISWKMFWLSKWKRIVNGIGRDLTPGRFRLLPALQSMRRIAMIYKLRHFIHVFFPFFIIILYCFCSRRRSNSSESFFVTDSRAIRFVWGLPIIADLFMTWD